MINYYFGEMGKKSDPVIVVNNLIKRYRKAETNAVGGVSFTVDPGEFFAFLGIYIFVRNERNR